MQGMMYTMRKIKQNQIFDLDSCDAVIREYQNY